MKRNVEWRYLFDIIRYSLSGGECPVAEGKLDWEYLYKLCKAHKIEAMVCNGVEHMAKEQQPPEKIMEKLKKKRKMETFRDAIQQLSLEELLDAFETEGIDCIPLKGILMKQFYPDTSLRMMADLDILYRPEQEEDVHRILLSKGYYCDHKDGSHNVYFRKPVMNIEMHHKLVPGASVLSDYYEKVWERAELQEGKNHTYRFRWEDYYIFMLVHLCKHFRFGGSGIRSVVDIWIFMEQMENQLDWNYIKGELKKIQMEAFDSHIRKLADIWFRGSSSTEFYHTLTEFMVNSGVYGTIKNRSVHQVGNDVKNRRSIWLAQVRRKQQFIFLPLKYIQMQYPWLEKYPILLPVAWIMRVFRTIFRKKGRASKVLRSMTVNDNDIACRRELFDELGIPI